MSLTYLENLQARLVKVQTAIEAAIDLPESYSIAGAATITNRKLDELRKEEASLTWRILQARGIDGKVFPNYSNSTSGAPNGRPSQ